LEVDLYKLFLYTTEKDVDLKAEINSIYDSLSKDKQLALYSIAKAIKN